MGFNIPVQFFNGAGYTDWYYFRNTAPGVYDFQVQNLLGAIPPGPDAFKTSTGMPPYDGYGFTSDIDFLTDNVYADAAKTQLIGPLSSMFVPGQFNHSVPDINVIAQWLFSAQPPTQWSSIPVYIGSGLSEPTQPPVGSIGSVQVFLSGAWKAWYHIVETTLPAPGPQLGNNTVGTFEFELAMKLDAGAGFPESADFKTFINTPTFNANGSIAPQGNPEQAFTVTTAFDGEAGEERITAYGGNPLLSMLRSLQPAAAGNRVTFVTNNPSNLKDSPKTGPNNKLIVNLAGKLLVSRTGGLVQPQ